MSDQPKNDNNNDEGFGHGEEAEHETIFKGSYGKKEKVQKDTDNNQSEKNKQ